MGRYDCSVIGVGIKYSLRPLDGRVARLEFERDVKELPAAPREILVA